MLVLRLFRYIWVLIGWFYYAKTCIHCFRIRSYAKPVS